MGLSLQGTVRRREDIEIAMEESMMEIVPRLEKRTPYVALASSIATLLGLLGTIMGLIQAFTAVCQREPRREGGPAVGEYLGCDEHDGIRPDGRHSAADHSHAVLTSKTGDIVDSLEMATVKFAQRLLAQRQAHCRIVCRT